MRKDHPLKTPVPRSERSLPLRCIGRLVCALCLAGGEAAALSSAEPAPDVIFAEVSQALADLSSNEFAQRQAAEQRLVAWGSPAFEPLVAELDIAPLDAGQRMLLILEKIWLQTPEPQSDILERQLETLRLTIGPYQPAVEHMLFAHHRLREQRASRALRRLNAIVETDVDEHELALLIQLGLPLPNEPPERIEQIILPRSWKGTEADLWHIQRLAHLKYLSVFVIENNGISVAAQSRMQIGFPDLSVVDRAEVYLGVIGSQYTNPQGCQVVSIQSGSAAEIAGLQVGDMIQRVDGVQVTNFAELVNSLKTKRGYQSIEIQVNREPDYQFPSDPFEEGRKSKPLILTAIGIPWEARRFPTPPPPPLAELLPVLPFPETPPLPGSPVEVPVQR